MIILGQNTCFVSVPCIGHRTSLYEQGGNEDTGIL